MSARNVILLSLDEVRADHLGCYGYARMGTPAFDKLAQQGTLFEDCFAASELTPIAMGAVITGKYPYRDGKRDPYSNLLGPTLGTWFRSAGFETAGFAGNGLLSRSHGFAQGFDFWNESTEETSWTGRTISFPLVKDSERWYEGNYWVERFFEWLDAHHDKPFFVWGHYFETHEGSENYLLEQGLIKEGVMPEFGYYDAKIAMVDETVIGRVCDALDRYGIADETLLVVMADHGTNLGEHEVTDLPWRERGTKYPQHTTMYDHDLRIALLMKGSGIPAGKRIPGVVRSIDLAPTILEIAGVEPAGLNLDGVSLLPTIERGRSEGQTAYAEDLFEARGDGATQAVRTDAFKFMRNLTQWTEEFYDIQADPGEIRNLVSERDEDELIELRKLLNGNLESQASASGSLSEQEKRQINERLRDLGYIQ